MNYQISRNGQMYGPYTLEDLQRYVASGNVLATDLAKNETMSEWVPVSQILAGAPSAQAAPGTSSSGFSQPSVAQGGYSAVETGGAAPVYGAPAYGAPGNGLAASAYPDAPNLHWALVLLFAVLTCGLFMVIWNFIISGWLRRVQPNANAIFFYAGAYALLILRVLLALPLGVSAMMNRGQNLDSHLGTTILFSLLGIAVWVLRLIARYSERASLEEHYNGPEPMGLRIDAVMTFFFGGLYFQSKLNDINAAKRAGQYGAMRPY